MSEGAVSQRFKGVAQDGEEALASHPPPGAPPKLRAAHKQPIRQGLAQGAEAHGFGGEVWISGRIGDGMARPFGVRDQRDPVRQLWRALGVSDQPPIERATPRDEEPIAAWLKGRWSEIKKGGARGG